MQEQPEPCHRKSLAYIMEGDTPSFLGLIHRGLGWHINPADLDQQPR